MRNSSIKRTTKETDISVNFEIDGSGKSSVNTGIPFMDHMLTLFAKHGFFDLEVTAKGDIEVDYHHTMEDLGLVLGEAIAKAGYEKDFAFFANKFSNCSISFVYLLNCFLKVDDVNAVSFCEDVTGHFWVPSSCLVTEVYTCFKQLFH